ncbi:MAG: hypothetical protein PHR06_00550 [Candidatus Cloacimonetes bacterium]|nr:hypothetical protein [Candidatus Cloacimonadota bacterium]
MAIYLPDQNQTRPVKINKHKDEQYFIETTYDNCLTSLSPGFFVDTKTEKNDLESVGD